MKFFHCMGEHQGHLFISSCSGVTFQFWRKEGFWEDRRLEGTGLKELLKV